jgi:hypothetical protein
MQLPFFQRRRPFTRKKIATAAAAIPMTTRTAIHPFEAPTGVSFRGCGASFGPSFGPSFGAALEGLASLEGTVPPWRTHELFAVNWPDAVHARLPTSKPGSLSSNPVAHENEHGTFSLRMFGHAMFCAFVGIAGRGPWQ